jgi:hypothetical protein
MRLTSVLLSLLFISAPGVTLAEEVYKSIMPNGSIVYGESPQSGARKVEKIDARSAVNGAIVATPEDKQRARELNGASTAAVGVIPQAPRESPTALPQGAISAPGQMPKRSY